MNTSLLLKTVVEKAFPLLVEMTDEASSRRPSPDKWSPREILGHLIDSAANNHRRFVLAQLVDHLEFDGYDQEAWVRVQAHETAEWNDLVTLWRSYNLHLARIVAGIPPETLERPRPKHNLHKIAWRAVAVESPATLEYFIRDYVGHMENHLRQIVAGYVPLSEAY